MLRILVLGAALLAGPASAATLVVNYSGVATATKQGVDQAGSGPPVTETLTRTDPITGSFTFDLGAMTASGGGGVTSYYRAAGSGADPFVTSRYASPGYMPLPNGDVAFETQGLHDSELIFSTGATPYLRLLDFMTPLEGEYVSFDEGRQTWTVFRQTFSGFNSLTAAGPIPTQVVDGVLLPDFENVPDLLFHSFGTYERTLFERDTGVVFSRFTQTVEAVGRVAGVTEVASGVVPEPGTWALMILGFGLAGGALRRRLAAALT